MNYQCTEIAMMKIVIFDFRFSLLLTFAFFASQPPQPTNAIDAQASDRNGRNGKQI
jgi:hypothetical protein